MNLLISNDDGIFSEGIRALARELSLSHNVTLIAPEQQQSGAGHGITCVSPVRVKKVTVPMLEDVKAYQVKGTPADCVRIGITGLNIETDMVVSGINHGANLGSDVLYSGTVGAAMEGALLGKPAIAVSCYNYKAKDFSASARAASMVIDYVKNRPLPKGIMLNVNAPELPVEKVKGIKLAGLCLQTYAGEQVCFEDPYGAKHFWMPLELKTTSFPNGDDFDEYWVRQGYVTVTPIHYDVACYEYMKSMDVSDFKFEASFAGLEGGQG